MYVLHNISIFFIDTFFLLYCQKTILNYFVCTFFWCVRVFHVSPLLYGAQLNVSCGQYGLLFLRFLNLVLFMGYCSWSYSGLQGRKQNQVPVIRLIKEIPVFLPGLSISIYQLFWTTFLFDMSIFYLDLLRWSNWV
jgi:hypothetical protein